MGGSGAIRSKQGLSPCLAQSIRILKRFYQEKVFIGSARTLEAQRLFYYTGLTKLEFVKLLEGVVDRDEKLTKAGEEFLRKLS